VCVCVCVCACLAHDISLSVFSTYVVDQQQSETQSGDKEEVDGEQSSLATASDKIDVAELLQQLQCSKTVEMVCSVQNMVNALHAIIISSVSILLLHGTYAYIWWLFVLCS